MHASVLLQWNYMIFLVPFGVAALLLLISSMTFNRAGHHSSGHHGHAHGGVHAHGPTHGHAHAHAHHAGPTSRHHAATNAPKAVGAKHQQQQSGGLDLLGGRYLSWPMLMQAFFVSWGFCGYWANRLLLQNPHPMLHEMLPSVGIALLGGILGMRGASFILSRVLPRDESLVVSRNELFGSTGRVAFPVSETGGRIHIYDDHGTLHDERCRVAKGQPAIDKGQYALVLDMDEDGRLIVERTSDPN